MIMGLEPEYNYPGEMAKWSLNNTKFASNHGASLISRSLINQFNGDFIDDFSDIDGINKTYDICILAFATHITTFRDVTYYTDIVKQLRMKVVAFSLGVQDYSKNVSSSFVLHESMKELLQIVADNSGWLGVRGPHTTNILMQNGFENVLPIGCPTFFNRLKDDLTIDKPITFKNPLVVYHRTLAKRCWHLCEEIDILGQDFLDEAIFTDNLPNDTITDFETKEYLKFDDGQNKVNHIKEKGIFFQTFREWFDFIGEHDFVFGPRLHGCIAALIQGIPAVMLYRDLRVKEMADFYDVPSLSYAEASKMSLNEIYQFADFEKFNETHSFRYNNYLAFLKLIGVKGSLEEDTNIGYNLNLKDTLSFLYINNKRISQANNDVTSLADKKELAFLSKLFQLYSSKNLFVRIPRVFFRKLKNFVGI